MMTVDCDSISYWREALFIASATHGEIPCAAKGWRWKEQPICSSSDSPWALVRHDTSCIFCRFHSDTVRS